MVKKSWKHVPVEDPEEALKYEIALEERPHGIKAAFTIKDGSDGNSDFEFKVGVLPETLIHQAVALLKFPDMSEDITTQWAFVTDDRSDSGQVFKRLILKGTADEQQPSQSDDCGIDLFEEQLTSLAWQLKQEQSPPEFTEQEIVEARIPQLGYRVMGKAVRNVRKRGGILAHDVGFGKTVLMLALISHRKAEVDNWAKENVHEEKRLRTKATLVFVPNSSSINGARKPKHFYPRRIS